MSQPKYRIVKRTNTQDLCVYGNGTVYVAQRKVLDMFWVDCLFVDPEYSFETYDENIEVVEKYIQRKLCEHQPVKDEVVKTFYEE